MVVQALMDEHGMSERRACQASGIARSTLRYRPIARDDSGVITFIQAYMALNPRHGFGLLYDSARHQGKPWGKTVLWRVYCELRLNRKRAVIPWFALVGLFACSKSLSRPASLNLVLHESEVINSLRSRLSAS